MGCTVSDEAHTHEGFTLYDMPGCGGIYEAENAARLEGARVHAQTDSVGHQGFRGQSFVDYLTADGSIQWNIEHCGAGAASVSFRYALRGGDRPLRVEVNGEVVQAQLSFPRTGSWATWGHTAQVEIRLVAGANSIRLVGTGSSGANVDSMTLTMEPTHYLTVVSWPAHAWGQWNDHEKGAIEKCSARESTTDEDGDGYLFTSCCTAEGGGMRRVCGSTRNTNFETAVEQCAAQGGRLCTADEALSLDENNRGRMATAGQGCSVDGPRHAIGGDLNRLWTSTPCSP